MAEKHSNSIATEYSVTSQAGRLQTKIVFLTILYVQEMECTLGPFKGTLTYLPILPPQYTVLGHCTSNWCNKHLQGNDNHHGYTGTSHIDI